MSVSVHPMRRNVILIGFIAAAADFDYLGEVLSVSILQ